MLFSDNQETTLRAVVDRVIPADDFPSGWDAGVGDYLYQQLSGDLCTLLPVYQSGLTAIDAEARARFSASFIDLTEDQQDTLLESVEAGDIITEWPVSPRMFFSQLVSHAAEGYYADPGQGGNRDKVSWKMIGFLGK